MSYTQFPNEILDEVLPKLTPNGWKLFCFVWRKTAGWNKEGDSLSYSQIAEATGMSSKSTIRNAITDVAKVIKVEAKTGRANHCYFDISPLVNGTETVPIEPVKSTVIGQKSTVIGLNGTETVPTKETITKDTKQKKKKADKPQQQKKPSLLEPTTEAEILLFKKINENRVARGWSEAKQFGTKQQKEKCNKAFNRLGREKFLEGIDYWMAEGIIAGGKLVIRLEKWGKNGHHSSKTSKTHKSNIPEIDKRLSEGVILRRQHKVAPV